MADTILISCPECHKQLRTPAHLQGKKIRCKACGHAFTAKARGGRDAADDDAPNKGKKSTSNKGPNPDYEADYNPYAVVETSFASRCPHCAAELEDEHAVICIECGYNLQERERHKTVKTYETTGMDYFTWLLPGIACVLLVLAMAGFIVFLYIWLKDIVEANKDEWWAVAPKIGQVWGTIFALFVMFFAGRFAIKRLIFHPTPPERLKQ
jgi:DNA-directed RNA polymerase subunit RPC12/RpoP